MADPKYKKLIDLYEMEAIIHDF